MSDDVRSKVRGHLTVIYPDLAHGATAEPAFAFDGTFEGLVDAVLDAVPATEAAGPAHRRQAQHWSERDLAVITYADSISEPGVAPMQTLRRMLTELTGDAVTVVHVLPFYPASSDSGFAIIDHRAVDERLGTWDDLTELSGEHRIMADLVVNHVSAEHQWMRQFRDDEPPGNACLLTAQPADDLSQVVRPRTTPLLRPVETRTGTRHLWCTFSHDQIDVDFRRPDVLLDLLHTLAKLLDAGVRWFRLDAVAYLWKELGTGCVHLPETHEVVKLLRTLLEERCADAVIITETNVPHEQNISYWGDGDEAHLVYNFSLPPLLVHTMLSGSATAAQQWLDELAPPQPGTTFFNFIASHDGIGLRPVEGLLSDAEISRLVDAAHAAGGTHSEFDTPAGPRAYELNVSLWDLFTADGHRLGVEQFIAAHTVMLALAGVPALYLHTMLGTPSYWTPLDRPPRVVTEHGLPPVDQNRRTINRRKLTVDEAADLLAAQHGVRRRALVELMRRMAVRRSQPAFHPDSPQRSFALGPGLLGVVRGSPAWGQTVTSITNVTGTPTQIDPAACAQAACSADPALLARQGCVDLLDGHAWPPGAPIRLDGCQTVWLRAAQPTEPGCSGVVGFHRVVEVGHQAGHRALHA